jgi:hypothetical protein
MKREQGRLLFSPSDLVRFVQSPFTSWMQRLCLEVAVTKSFKDKPDPLARKIDYIGVAYRMPTFDLFKGLIPE